MGRAEVRTAEPEIPSYLGLLRISGIAPAFGGAALVRLSYGMVSLSILLTVQHATGSFAVAGSTIGVYAITNFTAPLKARMLDRLGHTFTLLVLGIPYSAALTAAAVCGLTGTPGATPYLAVGAVAGLTAPPSGAAMRALWASVTPQLDRRRRAYSLDVASEATFQISGPVLTGALTGTVGPGAALVVTAAGALAGCVVMALCALSRRLPRTIAEPGGSRLLGPLRRRGFVLVLLAILGIGLALGLVDVAVAARASAEHVPGASGYVLGALSVGSALGGLLWGRLRHRASVPAQLALTLLIFGVGNVLAAFTPGLIGLGVVLAVSGLFVAPSMVSAYLLAESLAQRSERSESTTWVNNAYNIGSGLGSAGAGLLITGSWTGGAFLAGGVVVALMAAQTAAVRRRLRVADRTEDDESSAATA